MKLVRTPSGYLPCRGVLDFLHAYLDDELDAEQRQEFDRHLAVCPACVAYLETYRTTIDLGRGALAGEEGGMPGAAPLPADLLAAILATRR